MNLKHKSVMYDEGLLVIKFTEIVFQIGDLDVKLAVQDEYGSVANYLSYMSKDGAYGDGTILATIPFAFQRNVIVYYCDRVISLCDDNLFKNSPIRLGYVNDDHYVSLLYDKELQHERAPISPLILMDVEVSCDKTGIANHDQDTFIDTDLHVNHSDELPLNTKLRTTSTKMMHKWIITTEDGYYCRLGRESKVAVEGAWITLPVSKSNSKKLYLKADKHAQNTSHKMAVEKSLRTLTVKDDHFLSALNDHFTSKAPALTVREPRVVVCAAGSISHTWPSIGRAL